LRGLDDWSTVWSHTVSMAKGDTLAERGAVLSIIAVLMAVLAFSDFTKAFQHFTPTVGLVVFGHRTRSVTGNVVGGAAIGLFLTAYSYGLWTRRRWVLALAYCFAVYVPLNLALFWFFHKETDSHRIHHGRTGEVSRHYGVPHESSRSAPVANNRRLGDFAASKPALRYFSHALFILVTQIGRSRA